MLSLQGQFSFTAERPQLHCAAFFISEPEELITISYDLVSIDCQGGDFLQVRCPRPQPGPPRAGEMGGCCAPRGAAEFGGAADILS